MTLSEGKSQLIRKDQDDGIGIHEKQAEGVWEMQSGENESGSQEEMALWTGAPKTQVSSQ